MIQVENLSKSFKNIPAVRHLSFEVKKGEALGLLGPNGAGKTTTLRILAGFFPPSDGRVLIAGQNLFTSPKKVRRLVGYLPERVSLYDNLVTQDYLRFVADLKGVAGHDVKTEIERVMTLSDIAPVMNRLIGTLSQGFKQRIALAQALIGDPSVLILDEPTLGLDPKQVVQVRELIQRLSKDKTVILSSHILPEVSTICSRVLIIHEGALVASGTPGELAGNLRHSKEIMLVVRGESEKLEEGIGKVEGVIAFRLESSQGNEHTFKILYRKDKDVRGLISRLAVALGLELLSLQETAVSLEDIFLKIVLREEA